MRAPKSYSDPYLTGVGLGLVLLASYVLAGRGLGASGAFATVAAHSVDAVAPATAAANPWLAERAASGLTTDWLVIEMLGLLAGGFFSAAVAGRLRVGVERGARVGAQTRVVLALGGGTLMGAGAVLARGCTSGQALTGGALLSVGSWLFIAGAFGAGYLTMLVARRWW
jgi:uncharacterized membrane protein YedE/YeeE